MLHDAVLTGDQLIRCDLPDRPMAARPAGDGSPLMALEELAGVHSLYNIWLHPTSAYAQPALRMALIAEAETIRAAQGPESVFIDRDASGDELRSIRTRFRGDGRRYVINFPSSLWDFFTLDGPAMAHLISTVAREIGVQMLRPSPGATGLFIMRQSFKGHAWADALGYRHTLDDGIGIYSSQDLRWRRPITEEATHAYGYDVNSAYLACAASGDFGLAAPETTSTFQPKLPGFYAVDATPGGRFDGRDLPSPFTNTYSEHVTGWYAEPLVRFALEQGWAVTIRDGRYWPKGSKHRMMAEWAAQLWQARMHTEGATRATVKSIITAGIGRLGFTRLGEITEVYRPDWQALIIAEQRARRLRNVAKYTEMGFTPFAIDSDALYFASDTPIPIPIADTLGAYKDVGCFAVIPELRTGNDNINRLLQSMKTGAA